MWSLVMFLCLTTWAEAQIGRGQHQDHNGHGWDIRLAVPGEPGSDYPTLGAIPRTSFSCAGREPGYYADLETNCQVFRVCTVGSTYGFQSFLCPNGTLFNQAVFVCDWWMNVDCQNSQQFFNNNNDKFENLRLGPQLMKDIKKMLTHPMLNPYDKNAMKSNLIVMQDYKPPFGQLFPNGALLAGPERAPNNVYVPAKQIQQNLIQGNQNDYAFSASTPDPRYIPAPLNFVPLQRDTEVFQRQRQNEPFNSVNSIQNARVQTTQISQTGNLISNGHAGRFTQNSNGNFVNNNGYAQAPRPTQVTNAFSQRQTSQVVNNNQGNTLPNQRVQNNRPRAQYSEPRRLPQTNNEVPFSKIQNNANNNQNKQPYTYSPPTTNIPKYSNNLDNPAGRELKENLALVYSFLTDSINVAREYNNRAQQEIISSTSTPAPPQFQNLNNVTQIFNNPSAANIVNPSNIQQQTTQMLTLQQNTNQNSPKQSSPQYEVVKAETIALNPAKLQLEPPNEPEQFNSQETLNRILNSGNGISAQLQDKIVSTIPHPLEENKLLTYKKDQSYYLYTKLEDNTIEQNSQTNQQSNSQIKTAQNAKLVEGTNSNMANLVSFQLIPSVSYELEDEKEQQKFLNAFQIDEFGAPRDIMKSEKVNQGQIMTSSVDYSVEHPTTVKQNEQYVINPLYSGPSSYTAPQSSVGSLESRQIQQNNFNSRLEDFDSSNHNGYPKERPARHFFS
ncbi:putative uncharacterized protein DDB_G0282499 [Spodoptera litura]|uniref:Cuticular protein SlCPAP1-O n=1 Tax=Spodoptera litura TaxID=69820 RepID=A0A4U7BC27_SPOLT|nr:putative uncharacterized protein DDB_G0282499 [Spodoptera litura]TKX27731.1 cuticular protein SlCPAP1-O [Spodoptera litura]